MKQLNEKSPEDIYLEYMNDWLTIKAMSEYYNCSMTVLVKKIDQGRVDRELKFKKP